MPRFRFHLYNDIETIDEQGRDFPDLHAARTEAIDNARDLMAAELKSNGAINLNHWIELENDAGDVFVVTFRDAITITN